MEEFSDTEDAELSFLLSSKDSADVMSFVTALTYELEMGGIEQYLLNPSGADIFTCAWVVGQRDGNKNSPLAALLWDAMAIVGLATRWHHANVRKRAIDTLTSGDREKLKLLGILMLNCIYETDFITDC